MRKSITYIVTREREEEGETLMEQYLVKARSRKEALEEVLRQENIIIQEKEYATTERHADGKRPGAE